ncbi:MAG: cytochrome c oxidase subunit II, partial [Chloroflexi bacterium]|nr:cytochrome c oxidase subunit II [Chloroflexota bacterium]
MPHSRVPIGLPAVALLAVGLFLVGCTPSHPQSTFDTAGPVARSQVVLFYWIFWAAVFVFVTVEGVLLYSIIRFRRRQGQGMPPQIHGNTRLEIAWTIAPALVLAVVAVPTIMTIIDNARVPPGAMRVRVIGHQWWWEYQYPDLNIVAATELYIPVGKPVSITLESNDVIHSFWVPKLAGKTDAIPTNVNKLWLQADEPGWYEGQCAEFCGIAHALMRLRVRALPQEEFDGWVKAQQAPAATPPAPGPTKAGADYFKGVCSACHSIDGWGELAKEAQQGFKLIGPNLTHLASRETIVAGLFENNAENLARWLRNPPAAKPGSLMPNLRLSETDISNLVAYLQS